MPSSVRSEINFLQALRNVINNNLFKHIKGEFKVTPRTTVDWKIRVSGYHKNFDKIDLVPPRHGTANVPDLTAPSGQRMVIIGTPSNLATKGKIRLSEILNDTDIENMPYTAKVDAEIPPESGNFFPKKGHDGINTDGDGNLISGRSSMFPNSWTESKILEEPAYVRKNMTIDDLDTETNIYSG